MRKEQKRLSKKLRHLDTLQKRRIEININKTKTTGKYNDNRRRKGSGTGRHIQIFKNEHMRQGTDDVHYKNIIKNNRKLFYTKDRHERK